MKVDDTESREKVRLDSLENRAAQLMKLRWGWAMACQSWVEGNPSKHEKKPYTVEKKTLSREKKTLTLEKKTLTLEKKTLSREWKALLPDEAWVLSSLVKWGI